MSKRTIDQIKWDEYDPKLFYNKRNLLVTEYTDEQKEACARLWYQTLFASPDNRKHFFNFNNKAEQIYKEQKDFLKRLIIAYAFFKPHVRQKSLKELHKEFKLNIEYIIEQTNGLENKILRQLNKKDVLAQDDVKSLINSIDDYMDFVNKYRSIELEYTKKSEELLRQGKISHKEKSKIDKEILKMSEKFKKRIKKFSDKCNIFRDYGSYGRLELRLGALKELTSNLNQGISKNTDGEKFAREHNLKLTVQENLISSVAELLSGGGRFGFEIEDGTTGDKFKDYLVQGNDSESFEDRVIREFSMFAKKGYKEKKGKTVDYSFAGLYTRVSTHDQKYIDGEWKEKKVLFSFGRQYGMNIPFGGLGNIIHVRDKETGTYKNPPEETVIMYEGTGVRKEQLKNSSPELFQYGTVLFKYDKTKGRESKSRFMVGIETTALGKMKNQHGNKHNFFTAIIEWLTRKILKKPDLTGQITGTHKAKRKGYNVAKVTSQQYKEYKKLCEKIVGTKQHKGLDEDEQKEFFKHLLYDEPAERNRYIEEKKAALCKDKERKKRLSHEKSNDRNRSRQRSCLSIQSRKEHRTDIDLQM